MALTNGKKTLSEASEAHTQIVNHTLSIAVPMSLKCAVKLRIADILHSHGKPMPLHDLAVATSVPPEKEVMLRRLMRILVHHGIFADAGDCTYTLTPYSRLLLTDGPNMSAFVLALLDDVLIKAWYCMSDWFQADGWSSPCELAHDGRHFWDMTNERPELNDLFNEAMAVDSRGVIKTVIAEHPDVFEGLRSLVDVGGGTGTAARLIAEAFPEVKCTVFDLPHVVATLPESKAISAIGGSMFEHIPEAQAILLKTILHDWADEDCVKILKNCKSAISAKEGGGKVIIIDMVVNSHRGTPKIKETHLSFDVSVMVGVGGKERVEHEWRQIFVDAGFESYKIYPTFSVYSIIQLYP